MKDKDNSLRLIVCLFPSNRLLRLARALEIEHGHIFGPKTSQEMIRMMEEEEEDGQGVYR